MVECIKTETEEIRECVLLLREHLNGLAICVDGVRGLPGAFETIAGRLEREVTRIDRANEARDKSRTLPKVTAVIEVPDLSTDMCRGLLEIGFDTALSAVVPQLKTVEFRNPVDKTGICSWNPPDNPFRRASTTIKEDKDCGLGGCPKHARRENAPCIEEQAKREAQSKPAPEAAPGKRWTQDGNE
jgi:hypothetical protein